MFKKLTEKALKGTKEAVKDDIENTISSNMPLIISVATCLLGAFILFDTPKAPQIQEKIIVIVLPSRQ